MYDVYCVKISKLITVPHEAKKYLIKLCKI